MGLRFHRYAAVTVAAAYLLQIWLYHGLIRSEFVIGLLFVTLFIVRAKRFPKVLIALVLVILLVHALPSVFHATGELAYLYVGIKISFFLLAGYAGSQVLGFDIAQVRAVIRVVTCVSLAFFLVCLISESLQQVALSLKGETYGIEDLLEFYRLWFPTSGHTFHLGLFFLLLLFLQLLLNERIIWVTVTLVCCGIAARSSLLGALAVVLTLGFFKRPVAVIVVALVVGGVLAVSWSALSEHNEVLYALEPIIKFMEHNDSISGSSDRLLEKHIFFPENREVLFGAGRYFNSDGTYFRGTDSGLLRPVLYGGFVVLMLELAFLSVLIFSIFRLTPLGVMAWIIFLAMNVKAEVYSGGIHFAALMFFFFLMANIRADKNNIA